MQDFTRISGAINSAPLNDNFRKLMNDIDMTNMNIIWNEEDGIVANISEMEAIDDPKNGQACYVISSGELYRYYSKDSKWHKILDIGNTFRQGFLNSGAVVLKNDIQYKDENTLVFPDMLIYFKNAEGDGRYLRGMYLIKSKEQSFDFTGVGAYSVYVDKDGNLNKEPGLPSKDDPSHVFLGTFLVYKDDEGKYCIHKDFIYTLPDMAYTADRGNFIMNGGQASGLYLGAYSSDGYVKRAEGYYYDEGINYPQGDTSEYPYDTADGSNYDLKHFDSDEEVETIYYITPTDPLVHMTDAVKGLQFKYWNEEEGKIEDIPTWKYTIQEHIITPSGQNIIIYGSKLYNSMSDAVSNINSAYGLDIDFPYAQATRIVIGDPGSKDITNTSVCQFFTIGRLAQVGTISPVFADTAFRLYSGNNALGSNTPASMRFSLDKLEEENFDELYNLLILPYNTTRHLFYNDKKYIGENINPEDVIKDMADTRNDSYGHKGYNIADQTDITYLESRANAIEEEIWGLYDSTKQRYEQSLRYRLFSAETRLDTDDTTLADHESRIADVEKNKVYKKTSINGYTLGDTESNKEAKVIVLETGDIAEGKGSGENVNLWYTEDRVKNNSDVVKATEHIDTVSKSDNAGSHTSVNPHNISTDDVKLLEDTTRIFVSPEEERRIRADRLPEDTITALEELDEKNLDSIHITYQEGSSKDPGANIITLGDAKKLRFYKDGVKLDMDSDGETAIIECIGQVDDSIVMYRNRYATLETEYPDLYGGYVDKAVNAEYAYYVAGIESASANQYYGTNSESKVGIYDLPTYVASADASSYTSIDQVTFEPIDGSVQEKHLETSLKDKINNNYHVIYDGGTLKSAEINTFDFGNNLSVTINGNKATINATAAGEAGENKFTSLTDVDVTYTGNEGKMIVINEAGTGLEVAETPSTKDYMLRSIYVSTSDVSKVKKAEQADNATLASSATNALAVNNKSVDNTSTTEGLWTASQIISNTSAQIKSEGVNTYSGTEVPSDSVGKNGDLYILIES